MVFNKHFLSSYSRNDRWMNVKQLQYTRLTRKKSNFCRTEKCVFNEFTRQVMVAPSYSHPWSEASLDSPTPPRSTPRGRNKWKVYACARWNTPLPPARHPRSSRIGKPNRCLYFSITNPWDTTMLNSCLQLCNSCNIDLHYINALYRFSIFQLIIIYKKFSI